MLFNLCQLKVFTFPKCWWNVPFPLRPYVFYVYVQKLTKQNYWAVNTIHNYVHRKGKKSVEEHRILEQVKMKCQPIKCCCCCRRFFFFFSLHRIQNINTERKLTQSTWNNTILNKMNGTMRGYGVEGSLNVVITTDTHKHIILFYWSEAEY